MCLIDIKVSNTATIHLTFLNFLHKDIILSDEEHVIRRCVAHATVWEGGNETNINVCRELRRKWIMYKSNTNHIKFRIFRDVDDCGCFLVKYEGIRKSEILQITLILVTSFSRFACNVYH